LNKPCGSEDQIIPDSDGEEEDEDEEARLPTKKLNLAQFVYS
jgi:exonuclease-1